MTRPIVFLWENFGPMHADRVKAVASHFGKDRKIIGIEMYDKSQIHEWKSESHDSFEKHTLLSIKRKSNPIGRAIKIIITSINSNARCFFFCHYERIEILLSAIFLRAIGRYIFIMGDSKFDDYKRSIWREFFKSLFLLPYHGAISSGERSIDYLRFLGIRRDKILNVVNAVSIARWRRNGGVSTPHDISTHSGRPFICVARLAPEKNLPMLLEAYSYYRDAAEHPRDLEICGSGEMEGELRMMVHRLGLDRHVHFHGFASPETISRLLAASLALVLPSSKDTFGYVVIEAQACGLPVILSDNCGARDHHVRSGVNGFVIEADNPQGLAFFMDLLCRDAGLWARMAEAAWESASKGDVARFAESVARHVEIVERRHG